VVPDPDAPAEQPPAEQPPAEQPPAEQPDQHPRCLTVVKPFKVKSLWADPGTSGLRYTLSGDDADPLAHTTLEEQPLYVSGGVDFASIKSRISVIESKENMYATLQAMVHEDHHSIFESIFRARQSLGLEDIRNNIMLTSILLVYICGVSQKNWNIHGMTQLNNILRMIGVPASCGSFVTATSLSRHKMLLLEENRVAVSTSSISLVSTNPNDPPETSIFVSGAQLDAITSLKIMLSDKTFADYLHNDAYFGTQMVKWLESSERAEAVNWLNLQHGREGGAEETKGGQVEVDDVGVEVKAVVIWLHYTADGAEFTKHAKNYKTEYFTGCAALILNLHKALINSESYVLLLALYNANDKGTIPLEEFFQTALTAFLELDGRVIKVQGQYFVVRTDPSVLDADGHRVGVTTDSSGVTTNQFGATSKADAAADDDNDQFVLLPFDMALAR
jgi:hypothetical protein